MENKEFAKLANKIKADDATTKEKRMLLDELYRRKKISKELYKEYEDKLNVSEVIKFLLILAGVVLLGAILLF